MKHLAFVCALLLFPAAAAADPPDHVVNDAGGSVTLDCGDGGRVVVNGASNTVETTGGCSKVVVNGSGNTVAIAASDKIVVTGSNNTVTYEKGWKKKKPKVSRLGVHNTILKKK